MYYREDKKSKELRLMYEVRDKLQQEVEIQKNRHHEEILEFEGKLEQYLSEIDVLDRERTGVLKEA